METSLSGKWKLILQNEFEKPYFKELKTFVNFEYKQHTCYPNQNQIYSAFNYCSFDEIKVVIIGQDPYHGKNQANGLCFSVNDGTNFPPSLINIFKEIKIDLGQEIPKSGNLEHWAKQGVLLLNSILTVKENQAGSHQKNGWEKFTDAVIQTISDKRENIIFLLWGGYAKKKGAKIDTNKHKILTTGHPSPLSANRGYWFGNKHFSKTNAILKELKLKEINW